ncbi:MAG TPA: trypsin-like peptidase domain-containing protein [Caldilineaceae bacterium]|nr:trypsin-like peptidase domain-containing protein [Caldilineaceae bacterium]
MPQLDTDQLRQEDQRVDSEKSGQRIGVVRSLPTTVAALRSGNLADQWQPTSDGGHFQIITIESPTAYALRVHVSNLTLPAGAHVAVYDTNEPSESYGPYRARDLFETTELWTESVFGSTVTVEYYAPPGVELTEIGGFDIAQIAHIYTDPLVDLYASALSCQNDISCSSGWANEESAVAGLGTIGQSNVLWCSGALLNDFDDGTWEEYFLTANHCLTGNSSDLGTQAQASTIEFYWRYQTAACNQTPPALSSIQRTGGGADLISRQTRSSGNDHALLRIRNTVPGGLTFLGWDTRTPGSGEALTGIHHPDGEHKRISFGNYDSSNSNFWYVKWYDGLTEGGSSGSPLFDKNKRLIGQLFGGDTFCPTNTSKPVDQYGRFNQTYPSIERWMLIGGTINVNSLFTGTQLGTPTNPYRLLSSAYNFSWNGSRIRLQAGSYSGPITMSKQVTLIAQGGTVTIGQ